MSHRSVSPVSTAPSLREAQHGAGVFSRRSNPLQMMRGALLAADLGVVLTASMIAYVLRYGATDVPLESALITLLAGVLLVNILQLAGCYGRHLTSKTALQVTRALQGWSFVFAALLIFAYLTKTSEQFSRVWVATWFTGTVFGLAAVRLWAASRLRFWRRNGKLARTVAIVDLDGRGAVLAGDLLIGSAGEMHLLGVFEAQHEALGKSRIEDLLGLARLFRVDEIMISAAGRNHGDLEAILLKLGSIPSNVRLCLPMPRLSVPPRDASMLFGQPMLTLYHRPLGDWAKVAKRIEDLVLSMVAIVLLAPIMIVAAIAIKLDSPGPVLFRQRRLGFNNKVFIVFKFRSMTHRASSSDDVSQATRSDPRVTRTGWFLRRTSIDELPQLFNVLRGDMSLVGPRPHALAHNEQYSALIDGYLRRHRVQPGITGWAQVNGFRGETDTLEKMQRRVEYDLAYTDDWSLAFDVKILFMTVYTTFINRNVY